MIHATASWNTTMPAVQEMDPVSRLMVPMAATQGVYSRQKIISA